MAQEMLNISALGSGWEGEVVMWKVFVAFVCGMRLAAHVATVRRTYVTADADSPEDY